MFVSLVVQWVVEQFCHANPQPESVAVVAGVVVPGVGWVAGPFTTESEVVAAVAAARAAHYAVAA